MEEGKQQNEGLDKGNVIDITDILKQRSYEDENSFINQSHYGVYYSSFDEETLTFNTNLVPIGALSEGTYECMRKTMKVRIEEEDRMINPIPSNLN